MSRVLGHLLLMRRVLEDMLGHLLLMSRVLEDMLGHLLLMSRVLEDMLGHLLLMSRVLEDMLGHLLLMSRVLEDMLGHLLLMSRVLEDMLGHLLLMSRVLEDILDPDYTLIFTTGARLRAVEGAYTSGKGSAYEAPRPAETIPTVISALSKISYHVIAQNKGIRSFPSEDTTENDDDVYRSLEELADEHDLGENDTYDVPCEEDDIYEDIIKVENQQPMKMGMTEDDKRNCCLLEIRDTEERYCRTLEEIRLNYMVPLKHILTPAEFTVIFINLEELLKVHSNFLKTINISIMSGGCSIGQVFLDYKEKLLLYGEYCSHIEYSQKTLDQLIDTRDDVRTKIEECSMKVQDGKFKLQDLMVIPMQRVLKYHLLLKELLSHTAECPERLTLKEALEAMQDLAMYINEVKRDKETLKKISEFQNSIENLQVNLEEFGRPKIDGELKVRSIVNQAKQDRYLFLFDKVIIVCKRKGYSYELKEMIELLYHKMSDDPTYNKDVKKWSYGFYLIHLQGKQGFQFFCKTEEMKRKWMEQFEMAISNIKPDKATANHHNFQMFTFDRTTSCKACKMFLR
ncbi:unnamed protein product [Ranitomeya imitator]|uniref:Guanine nucleotide exchange factor VAV2 n=1 Tax=Ranitomeya imitator TaxID=111125 RepID=A0ABN9KT03_9NEOB|nr:unnamed protein product [Ranitomeya imitator]